MAFSPQVAEEALVASGRHCILCHRFCGTKIELHHAVPVADGGDDSFENCIPLCFDCHAEVEHYNPRHPKGRKFTASELQAHRDRWYERLQGRREGVDDDGAVELDKVVFQRLRGLLPSEGSVSFVRHNNFAGFSFPIHQLDQLQSFLWECEHHPEFEFVDPDLEGLRGSLEAKIREFLREIAHQTFPVHNSAVRCNTVPPEWEIDQPERFEAVVSKLHGLTGDITDTYDSLVRLARRRVRVPG